MIDNQARLGELISTLQKAAWIAIDTEADSLHAYPEKLCLLQISVEGADELVDPLAGLDLQALWKVFREHELILHGADYDLRLLRKGHDFVPTKIFDTMLAARLLGITEFGLHHLVQRFLNVQLEKGSQKADWAKRPLTERMEAYARNDTRYLKPVRDGLTEELQKKSRLEWHAEMCARLVAECAEVSAPDPDAWRIKGSARLTRGGLAILKVLWEWREKEAIERNRPPYFVLNHESLVEIANSAAQGRGWKPALPHRFPFRKVQELEGLVELALQIPPEQYPVIFRTRARHATEAEKRRLNHLRARRDQRAQELEIDPTLIASRNVLSLLAEEWERHAPRLMQWQRALLE